MLSEMEILRPEIKDGGFIVDDSCLLFPDDREPKEELKKKKPTTFVNCIAI